MKRNSNTKNEYLRERNVHKNFRKSFFMPPPLKKYLKTYILGIFRVWEIRAKISVWEI